VGGELILRSERNERGPAAGHDVWDSTVDRHELILCLDVVRMVSRSPQYSSLDGDLSQFLRIQ